MLSNMSLGEFVKIVFFADSGELDASARTCIYQCVCVCVCVCVHASDSFGMTRVRVSYTCDHVCECVLGEVCGCA